MVAGIAVHARINHGCGVARRAASRSLEGIELRSTANRSRFRVRRAKAPALEVGHCLVRRDPTEREQVGALLLDLEEHLGSLVVEVVREDVHVRQHRVDL